jgi:hypothetical protein
MRLARVPYTFVTGVTSSIPVVVSRPAMEGVMGLIFYLVTVAATTTALQVPALAQENAAPSSPAPAQPPVAAPAQGQPSPPQPQESEHGRFVFHRVDGSVLRLDMVTGSVALCTSNGPDLACIPGRDERAALDRQIAQLQHENAVLKNALVEHGVPLPEGMTPAPPSGAGHWWSGDETIPRPPQTVPPTATPPGEAGPPQGGSSESGVDRIIDAMKDGWQRLVEMMTNLRRELEK